MRKELLVNEGFDFNYFTNYWKAKKGNVYFFCFEFGFRDLKDGKYMLILWQDYMKGYGHTSEKPIWLMPIFEDHNEKMRQLIGKEFSPLTYERYVTSKKHTQEFIRYKFHQDDFNIKKLDYEFIAEYEFWFKFVRNCDHNTTVKYLSNFRKIVNICVKVGKISKDPFFGYKMVKREIERPFLVDEELTRISHKEFVAPRLNQVRDIFLFSCFTDLLMLT